MKTEAFGLFQSCEIIWLAVYFKTCWPWGCYHVYWESFAEPLDFILCISRPDGVRIICSRIGVSRWYRRVVYSFHFGKENPLINSAVKSRPSDLVSLFCLYFCSHQYESYFSCCGCTILKTGTLWTFLSCLPPMFSLSFCTVLLPTRTAVYSSKAIHCAGSVDRQGTFREFHLKLSSNSAIHLYRWQWFLKCRWQSSRMRTNGS